MKRSFTILLFLSGWQYMNAQPKNNPITRNTIELPLQLSPKRKINKDFKHSTLGFSVSDFQHTFRNGARYSLIKKWNAAAGIVNFNTRAYFNKQNKEFVHEFWNWQQVAYNIQLRKKLSLQNRLLAEERRFISSNTRIAREVFPLRYRLAFIQSITKRLQLTLVNEYMRQLKSNKLLFQHNRLNIAGEYLFNTFSQALLGYIWSKLSNFNQYFITFIFLKRIVLYGNRSK
jgi:hypothetical protein